MMIRTLAAGAALAMLVSGAAYAAPKAKAPAPAAAAPTQPIPYAQLDAYLKASPKARASKDWWSGSASTGAAADTSATMPAAPATPDGSVNPPTSSTLPADPAPAMPATPPTMPDAMTPAPGSNLPGATTEPK